MQLRASFFSLTASLLIGVLLAGCKPQAQQAPVVEAPAPAPVEEDESKSKLSAAEKRLDAKIAELSAASAAQESLKTQLAEKELVVVKKDSQLKILQSEIEDLKKRDGFIFAAIAGIQQGGDSSLALSRYKQFLKDYPKSPLVANAEAAINSLTVVTEQETKARANVIDPQRRQREFVQQFEDGFLSLQDLAPVLKKKSVPQVLALLGAPNRIFGDGTEIGYADKAIDPVTGKRGMFIIAFELDAVANLRVEYTGRRMVP